MRFIQGETDTALELLAQPVAAVDDTGILKAWNTRFVRHCIHPPSTGASLSEVIGLPTPFPIREGCVEIGDRRLLCFAVVNNKVGVSWIVFLCGEEPDSEWRHELSSRVRHVVDLVRVGMTNKEIAAQLGISESTVKKHVSSALRAAGAERRFQLLDAY